MKKKLLLIETDIGTDVDDAIALTVLCKKAPTQLFGIICTNGPVYIRTQITSMLLKSLQLSSIPIFQGFSNSSTPKKKKFVTNKEPEGIEICSKPNSRKNLIHKILQCNDQTITLIIIAPPTTSAWLLQNPHVKKKIEKIIIMGGVCPKPHIPLNEHNFSCDPRAVSTIIKSDKPLFVLSLDQTLKFPLSKIISSQLAKKKSKTAILISRWMITWIAWSKKFIGENSCFKEKIFLHDPLACMAVIQPNLFHWKKTNSTIDANGVICFDKGNPIHICTKIEQKVRQEIEKILTTL